MAASARIVEDNESVSLAAMELVIGNEFDGTLVQFGSVGRAAEDEYIDNQGNPTGLNVATIAAFHEFGKGPNLTRSFVGAWTDANHRAIGDAFREGVEDLLDGFGSAQRTGEEVGVVASEGIHDFIADDNVRPELGDWWVFDPWRDPDGIPIYDTRQVAESMSFTVETG